MLMSLAKLFVTMGVTLVLIMLAVIGGTAGFVGAVYLISSEAKADGVCIPLYPGACSRHVTRKPTR